jgi:ketosteroid isomerase-like protein
MTRSNQVIGYQARHRLPDGSVSRGGADGNLAIVDRIYEALRRGDTGTIVDAVADDVDWAAEACSPAGSPGYRIRHGKDEVAADLTASTAALSPN